MAWIKGLVIALAVLLVALVALNALGAARWAEGTAALRARLQAAREPPLVARYDARELAGLPAPVQRFFRAALTDGQPVVTAASIAHSGSFNMGQTRDQWKPFTSTQRVVTRRPGFAWDGRVMMLPGVPVQVHDAYVAGEGLLQPSVFGLFSLTRVAGGGEIARGELMRFFAEAAWYPTALLPSQGVRWEAVDEQHARATLVDGDIRLTMAFGFGADGLIETVLADARGRMEGDRVVMAPWQGRFWNYERRSGMQVPLEGEVAWLLPAGRKPYWRGRTTALAYEFAP